MLIVLILSISVQSCSQENIEKIEVGKNLNINENENEQWGFIGFPLPFYSLKRKTGLGVGFIIYRKPDSQNNEIRLDELEFNDIGTQNKQLDTEYYSWK